MSTYTDLHNKLKETINVDYRTRNTNQEVHLLNERNEYWGQFKGRVDIEESTISKAQLSDVTLNGDIYVNGRFIGGGLSVDVNKIMDTVEELSTNLYNDGDVKPIYGDGDIVRHDKKFASVDEDIKSLDKKIEDLKLSSSSDLSAVSAQITSQVSSISTSILTTVEQISSALVSEDERLSAAISAEAEKRAADDNDLMLALDAESNERQLNDDLLSTKIETVNSESRQRDFQIESDLEQHAKDNAKQFKDLEERTLAALAHDKHYSIYDNEEILKSYPYALKDFAVNVLKTSLKDGIVLNDADIPVANVVLGGKTGSGEDIYVVTFYDILEDISILQAVWPGSQFKLHGGVTLPTHKNGYKISLKDGKIYLVSEAEPYLELHYDADNQLIGKIKKVLSSDDAEDVISGLLLVDAGKSSELSTFNKFKDVPFNDTDLSVQSIDTEEIVYKRNEKKFIFREGVYDKYYCQIKDVESSNVFGRIYKGNVKKVDDQIDSIKVNIDSQEVLLSSSDFKTDYSSSLSTYMLCCNIDDCVFEKREKHAFYQYGYYDNDKQSGELRGHVILTAENETIEHLNNFSEIKIKIENTDLTSLAGREITLQLDEERLPLNHLWKGQVKDAEHDLSVNFIFNGRLLQLNGTIEGQDCNFNWTVNREDVSIANIDEAYSTLVYRSEPVDLETYPEKVPGCRAEYDVNYQVPTSRKDFRDIVCNISSDNLSSVDVIVPAKEEGSDISREFIVVANITSLQKKVGLNVQGHLPNDPVEISFNGQKAIEISSNANMVLQFNEIANHKFIVTDLEDHFKQDQIDYICRDLETKAEQISVLSDDVADIYKQIKGGLAYKDTLSIDIPEDIKDPDYRNGSFVDLFFNNYWIKAGREHRNEILGMPLRNGFYYISKAADKSTKYTFEDQQIANGDLIIIKENTLLSDLSQDKVNIIDVFDADAVHKAELSAVSSAIELSVHEISNAISLSAESVSSFMRDNLSARIDFLSNEVSEVSSLLSNETIRLDEKIDKISGKLSNEISTYAISLSTTTKLSIESLQEQIISNDNDIQFLSSKTEFLLSVDKEHVAYQGTMAKYAPADPKVQTDYHLSAFIDKSLNPDFEGHLKLGFMFRLSAEQSCLYDANLEKIYFGKNDYFIVNKDVLVKDVLVSDIDIIRDAQGEFLHLSNEITAQISTTSALLSGSANYLSSQISILSGELSSISADIVTSCDSMSTTINRLSIGLSGDIDSLSTRLSNEISDLSYHYNKSFEKDVHVNIDKQQGIDISVDLLRLTDQDGSGQQYTLHLSAGTLVLMPIKK